MDEPVSSPSDKAFVALMTSGDHTPLDRYFLLGTSGRQLVALWHVKNAIMACVIEDNQLAAACKEYLRRRGHPTFIGVGEVYAHAARMQWPGWESYYDTESNAATDRGRL